MTEETTQTVEKKTPGRKSRASRKEARYEYQPTDYFYVDPEIVEWAKENNYKLKWLRFYKLDGYTEDRDNLQLKFREGWQPVTTDILPGNVYTGTGVNPFLSGSKTRTVSDKMIRAGQNILAYQDLDTWNSRQRAIENQALAHSRQYLTEYRENSGNNGIVVRDESVFE